MTGKTFSQGWGSVVVHRDAAAAANVSGGTTAAAPIAHHRAAMRGERGLAEQEGRGFRRRGQDAKLEQSDGEHLAARSEKLRDGQADRG